MCGISGFNWGNRELISQMNSKLKHRGPDDSGVFSNKEISLGHTRLSILDLSGRAHQPMSFENLTIVYNGEVYNFKSLKNELESKGYKFTSSSDSEVVLKAWHAWGSESLQKFNGIFAFAIFDTRSMYSFI